MPTIREVARLARVSPSTVSRVLNDTVPVSGDIRERVLDAIRELDYRPNAFARGLATNRSGGLGVMVNNVASPYYGAILEGIERQAERAGYHVMVASGYTDPHREQAAVRFLLDRRSDALILHPEAIPDDDVLRLRDASTPLVLVGRYIAELDGNCVHLDNEMGGQLATRYLIDRGHERIGHICGPLHFPDSRARLTGYRRALDEAGIAYDDRLVVEGDFAEEGGDAAARKLLARGCQPTALFCANDQTAAGAMRAVRELGLSIPDDLSMVGYDDVYLARYLYPALTTVKQPLAEMGSAAAQLALSLIRGEETEVERQFRPRIVERASVAPPAAERRRRRAGGPPA